MSDASNGHLTEDEWAALAALEEKLRPADVGDGDLSPLAETEQNSVQDSLVALVRKARGLPPLGRAATQAHAVLNRRAARPLDEEIWAQRQAVRAAIDAVLLEAIETGEDPEITAAKLERFLSPQDLVHTEERAGNAARPPGGGWATYAARRLVRNRVTLTYSIVERLLSDPSPLSSPRKKHHRDPPRRTAVPRPTGRRVIEAIVKHPKGDRRSWIARCGNASKGCRGVLGWVDDADEAKARIGSDPYSEFLPEQRPSRRWVLRHDEGYGGDQHQGYRPLPEGRRDAYGHKIGRGKVPERLEGIAGLRGIEGFKRGFVGQLPVLPCLVECPTCNTLNRVGEPSDR